MRAYVGLLISAGLTVVALLAAIVLRGGWEAAASGLGLLTGVGCVGSLIVL